MTDLTSTVLGAVADPRPPADIYRDAGSLFLMGMLALMLSSLVLFAALAAVLER